MRLTIKDIRDKKKKRMKITVLTAYDFPMARIVDECDIDIVLVGDSLGMVLLGYDSTVPVTMRDMVHHTRAVSKAVRKAVLVADMPFGSYDTPERALRNAKRLIQGAGADAVKLEGGQIISKQIQSLVRAGIPVMGHVGMTPQTASQLGGYRVQGRVKAEAEAIIRDARLLDRLGVFSMVLECVPSRLARKITRQIKTPTIGIGAGPATDGQVLVLYDLLGFHSIVRPKFVRTYADLDQNIRSAVSRYRADVLKGLFPAKKESY